METRGRQSSAHALVAGASLLLALLVVACTPGRPAVQHRPADFGFCYVNQVGERFDSIDGLVTKDRRAARDTTIALPFTPSEMDTVYQAVLDSRLLELPNLRAPEGMGSTPSRWHVLRIHTGGKERAITWESAWIGSEAVQRSPSWKAIRHVLVRIRMIVEAKPQYRSLPPAEGAYD